MRSTPRRSFAIYAKENFRAPFYEELPRSMLRRTFEEELYRALCYEEPSRPMLKNTSLAKRVKIKLNKPGSSS